MDVHWGSARGDTLNATISGRVVRLTSVTAAATLGKAGVNVPCEEPVLRYSLPTTLEDLSAAAWESVLPAPWEKRLDRLAAQWDRCTNVGGRLWEVRSPEAEPHGALSICAPKSCRRPEVEGKIWPVQLKRLTGKPQPQHHATALELSHWRNMKLDFVLAGFEKCGTSTLSHNMARHSQLEFVPEVSRDPNINTDNQEAQDGNFFWFLGNRLLPPAALVDSFNRGECCMGGAMPVLPAATMKAAAASSSAAAAASSSKSARGGAAAERRVLRGERNPVYAFHRFIMKAVSLVPTAKIVLIICDPVGWLYSAYGDTTNWYAARPGDPPQPPISEFAEADMVAASTDTSLSRGGWYNLSRRRALFTLFLRGLAELFGEAAEERLHVLHRDSVDDRFADRESMAAAYGRLAAFLGIEAFPKDFAYERRNVRRPAPSGRTDAAETGSPAPKGKVTLCGEADAASLAKLRRYYRWEFRDLPAILRRFGGLVPWRMLNNRTACDA
eukprot:TRINITY_DN65363_c0_g1_i1.p1 TRINITY_DN65363_c0_g1~~TRINITY_DN65363_c0_g1_i1.p1  ORF type:complete len:499 (-),score=87.19 TRINITY_DN65363_c0_g1_i1:105-1601(-)